MRLSRRLRADAPIACLVPPFFGAGVACVRGLRLFLFLLFLLIVGLRGLDRCQPTNKTVANVIKRFIIFLLVIRLYAAAIYSTPLLPHRLEQDNRHAVARFKLRVPCIGMVIQFSRFSSSTRLATLWSRARRQENPSVRNLSSK